MATRSRLGRDPLQAAPKPSAKKTAPSRRKPAAAKTDAPADAATEAPRKKPTPAVDTAANIASDSVSVATPEIVPDAPIAIAPSQDQPFAAEATAQQPAPDVSENAESVSTVALAGDEESPVPDEPDAASLADVSSPNLEMAAAVQETTAPPQKAAASDEACPAACPETASPALATDTHPVAVFLRGVLEGLLPEGEAALCIDVDETTSALPVEKLFFFSHALQRIATPLENAVQAAWRPGTAAAGPLPVLTVRLRPIGQGRHSLTLFDNGCFFKSRLPGLTLGMEALTPLTAFVAKRQGSVVLAQGRVTAFEIIG